MCEGLIKGYDVVMSASRLFVISFLISLVGGFIIGSWTLFSSQSFNSVELGVAEPSFLGFVGGFVSPASCNSYEHTPGECTVYSQPYYEGYYQPTYPPYAEGYYQPAYPPPGECTPSTDVQTLSCPAGQTGSITRARSSWCPGPQWTEWFETSTCTNGPVPPVYAQGAYPPGYAQGAYPPTYSQGSYGSTNPTVTGTPTTVTPGGTVTITWSDPLDRSCNGIGFSAGGASSGTVTVNPATTTDYGVQCGSGQTVVTITVTNPVLTIGATPARVRSGSASAISWSATSVTSCTLTGTGINTSCSGSACGNPHTNSTGALFAQTVYTLACQTGAGSKSATATVFITPSVCEVGTVGCPE